jgi:hypothetical protein
MLRKKFDESEVEFRGKRTNELAKSIEELSPLRRFDC